MTLPICINQQSLLGTETAFFFSFPFYLGLKDNSLDNSLYKDNSLYNSRKSVGYSRSTLITHPFELLLVYLLKSNCSGSIYLNPLVKEN